MPDIINTENARVVSQAEFDVYVPSVNTTIKTHTGESPTVVEYKAETKAYGHAPSIGFGLTKTTTFDQLREDLAAAQNKTWDEYIGIVNDYNPLNPDPKAQMRMAGHVIRGAGQVVAGAINSTADTINNSTYWLAKKMLDGGLWWIDDGSFTPDEMDEVRAHFRQKLFDYQTERNKKYDDFKKSLDAAIGLKDDGFSKDLLNGIGSLGPSLLGYWMGGPLAISTFYGAGSGGEQLYELQKAGYSDKEATIRSDIGGLLVGAVQGIGDAAIFEAVATRTASKLGFSKLLQVFYKGAQGEFIEEGAEGLIEGFNLKKARNQSTGDVLLSALYQAVLGGLVGGIVGGIGHLGNNFFAKTQEKLVESGMDPDEAAIVTHDLERATTPEKMQEELISAFQDDMNPAKYKDGNIKSEIDERLKQLPSAIEEVLVKSEANIIQRPTIENPDVKAPELPEKMSVGGVEFNTSENPNLGNLLYQMEQEGTPAKTFADILEKVEEKIDVAGTQKTIGELNEVEESIKNRLLEEGNYGADYAQKAAGLATAQVYAASKMWGISPKEFYENRFPSIQKKAFNEVTKQIEDPDYIPFQTKDALDLTQTFKGVSSGDPAVVAKAVQKHIENLIGEILETATKPLKIQLTKDNKYHVVNTSVDLKGGQKKRHQAALLELEKIINAATKSDKDGTVDTTHNTRAQTLKHKERVEKYVYFDSPVKINEKLYNVEFATEQVKGQDPNTLDLYNVHVKNEPETAFKNTLSSDSNNSIGQNSENVKQNFQGEGNPLGAFDMKENAIYLFETANRSTFVHEMGHFFMNEMLKASDSGVAKALEMKSTLDKWLKHTDGSYTSEEQEKFARGFEAYLWEGNAPNNQMKGVFQAFKQWLRDIYRSIGRLKVRLNKDVRGLYSDMLGGADIDTLYQTDTTIKALDNEISAIDEATQEAASAETEYAKQVAEVMAEKAEEKWSPINSGKEWIDIKKDDFSGIHKSLTQIFTPLSTRAKAIDQSVALRIRQMMHDEGQFINSKMVKIKPLLDGVMKMKKADIARFDSYMKNGIESGLDALFEQYNLTEEYAKYREAMDEIYQAADSVGIQMNYRDTYAPRKVKNTTKFLDHIHSANAGLFSQMIAELGNSASEAEQADWLDQHLRSWGAPDPMTQTPGNVKNRKIQVIDAELDKFYYTTPEAISMYVDGMAKAISMRSIWGATPDMSADGMSNEGLNKSIGEVIAGLKEEGKITTNEQAKEMKDILNALLGNHGTQPKWLSRLKTGAMASMLTKGLQTISQFADIGTSIYSNGIKNTLSSFAGHDITLDMVGIEKLTEEYRHRDGGAKALDFFFKWSGFSKMDVWGKQTFLNAKYKSLVEQATKSPEKLRAYLEPMFEERTGRLIGDLKSGKMSQDVNLLLFSELSEIQPTTMAEMPSGYVNHPNGRLWYMLKTFSLRRLDFILNETYRMYRNGQGVQATKNLISLAICVGGAETLVALLKDWLRGKELDVADTAIDSLMGMFMLNRYQMWKLRSSGPEGFIATLLPPVAPIATAVFEDLPKIADGKLKIKDARAWTYLPLVGDAYYWWLGGGHTKEQKKKRKR